MKIKNFNKFLKIEFGFFIYMFSSRLLNSNHEATKIKSNKEISTTEYFNIRTNNVIKIRDVITL